VVRGSPEELAVDSEAVVLFAEGVFIGVVGFFGGGFSVVDDKSGGVPLFPFEHGVIVVGEGFFGADGVDPGVVGLFVGGEECVEIWRAHGDEVNAEGEWNAGMWREIY
jgi:hypothetical protein